tara:strand:+ start:1051 stop:1365 length:315 start_codon:yes stop_codon:yes gene_type:complete
MKDNMAESSNYLKKIETMSEFIKALANPIRLKIALTLLQKDGCDVNSMVDSLEISQPGVSQHLNVLKRAKLVKVETRGSQRCYSIKDENTKALILKLFAFNAQA